MEAKIKEAAGIVDASCKAPKGEDRGGNFFILHLLLST